MGVTVSYLASPIFSWILACFLTSTLAAYCIKKVQDQRRRQQCRGQACEEQRSR